MILQNLSRAIREQNYYAVVLEFLIVIAGVVIGFQINAWNEARAASAAAVNAVTRLRTESEAVVTFWVEDVAGALEQDRNRVALLRALRDGSTEPGLEGAVYLGIERLYFYPAITPPRTVFDELLASGGMSLMTDPEANAAVSEYADQLTFITGQLDQFRPGNLRGLSAMDGLVFSEVDLTDYTLRRLEYDIAALSQDRTFVSSVVEAARNQRVFLFFRMGSLRAAFEMCEALSTAQPQTCDTAQDGRDQLAAAQAYLDDVRETE